MLLRMSAALADAGWPLICASTTSTLRGPGVKFAGPSDGTPDGVVGGPSRARLPTTIAPSSYFGLCTAMRAPGATGRPFASRNAIGPCAVSMSGIMRESPAFAPSWCAITTRPTTVCLVDASVASEPSAMAPTASNASALTVATPSRRGRGRDLSTRAPHAGSALP